MKIAIGNDHIGISLIGELNEYFKTHNFYINHLGTFTNERMDYPEIAFKVSEMVANGTYDQGILVCGTGLGMSLAANKVKGIRAVVCSEPYSAQMSIKHNNANILCLGARVIGTEMAKMILDGWFNSKYENGRHQNRVKMIDDYEK